MRLKRLKTTKRRKMAKRGYLTISKTKFRTYKKS